MKKLLIGLTLLISTPLLFAQNKDILISSKDMASSVAMSHCSSKNLLLSGLQTEKLDKLNTCKMNNCFTYSIDGQYINLNERDITTIKKKFDVGEFIGDNLLAIQASFFAMFSEVADIEDAGWTTGISSKRVLKYNFVTIDPNCVLKL